MHSMSIFVLHYNDSFISIHYGRAFMSAYLYMVMLEFE